MNRKWLVLPLLLLLLISLLPTAAYADEAEFEYKLTVTDQNGNIVTNPRSMSAGDTLNVEIELRRVDTTAASYETYGLEFRLMSRGLSFNNDGASFRNGSPVKQLDYASGTSVGFAYYDMEQKGERISNPVLAGQWSYTVEDPGAINITVPVAIMYVVNDSESYEPIGNALLYLDPNGGAVLGEDISGEYRSGSIVTLPGAVFGDYVFMGWSDGEQLYQAGDKYVVSGIVTLTAQWEGLIRDRHIIFDVNGGEFVDDDPGGMYADGESIILPKAVLDGYVLDGWLMDGELYKAGDEYIVDNSVVFQAQWKPVEMMPQSEPEETNILDSRSPLAGWFMNEDGTVNGGKVAGAGIGGLGLLGLLIFLILWKRRWVLYSLKNGDVALSYKDKEHNVQVEVVLFTDDENGNRIEYHLNKSGSVEARHRLRFIHGQPESYPIVPVEKGKYKGKLIITDGAFRDEKKCRIKVLDREIRERENK